MPSVPNSLIAKLIQEAYQSTQETAFIPGRYGPIEIPLTARVELNQEMMRQAFAAPQHRSLTHLEQQELRRISQENRPEEWRGRERMRVHAVMGDGRDVSMEITDPSLMARIASGVRYSVSMGCSVSHPVCPLCSQSHPQDDCPHRSIDATPVIDGPTPSWVVAPATPAARSPIPIGARRVEMPLFEMASNPTVHIAAVASRRFGHLHREYVPGRALGDRFRAQEEPKAVTYSNVPRPYCPTSWEKISGSWLDE